MVRLPVIAAVLILPGGGNADGYEAAARPRDLASAPNSYRRASIANLAAGG
jgi:hypothetical protein